MINKIILGTVQLGIKYGINNPNSLMLDSEANNILELALKEGIQVLDTAADYGDSEKRIGVFFKGRNRFNINTKFTRDENVNWKDSLFKSLRYLKINKIDTIMFHSFESYMKSKGLLSDIINEGKGKLFNRIGVSVYTNDELKSLTQDDLIDVVQCPFNMLDNESHRADCLINLKQSGKVIHTRSVFLQGLFFIEPDKLPQKLLSLAPYCHKLHSLARMNNIQLGHLAIQYVLEKQYIDGILIGVDTVEQLKTNIHWIKTTIKSAVFDEIDKIFVQETELLNPAKW